MIFRKGPADLLAHYTPWREGGLSCAHGNNNEAEGRGGGRVFDSAPKKHWLVCPPYF